MSPRKTEKKDPASFEKSLKRLEEIVEQLEEGDTPLDLSMRLTEEGKKLGKQLEKQLSEIEKKILKIVDEDDEDLSLEPFDSPEADGDSDT